MKAIATLGPLSAAMGSSETSFQFYSSGIYSSNNCNVINHSVTIVGYGSSATNGAYYIVKNSWGTLWGIKGYFHLARNKGNQCGIASYASYYLI